MSPVCLFPEDLIQDAGFGPEIDVTSAMGKPLLLTLSITRMMEQHTLTVAIWGSPDQKEWGGRPLTVLPKRFYCGDYNHLLDLSQFPDVRYLRLEYALSSWGYDDRPKVSRFSLIAEPAYELALAAAG